jgi:hypothetical protein
VKNAFTVRRLAPGSYLVNDQFEVIRGREGMIGTNGVLWYWRERGTFNNHYADTLKAALHDLQAHLDATARKSAVAAELGRLGGAATSTAKAAAARANGAKGGRPRKSALCVCGHARNRHPELGPCMAYAHSARECECDQFQATAVKSAAPDADGLGLQQQPTLTACGPTCVAMIVGVPVAEVLDRLPATRNARRAITRAGVDNTNLAEVLRLLRPYGFTLGRRLSLAQTLPPVALLRLRLKHHRNWHWAVWKDGQVFDPATGTRRSTLVFAEYHDVTHYEVEVTR